MALLKKMNEKIIVLTPTKNEDWIIEQFLTISSFFADHIIIADQQSTDNTRNIALKFPKVELIDNNNDKYDEASRQILLIETARRLFPNDKRIFICLDADELLSANSLHCPETWLKIKNLVPGTSIYFEKPDVLYGIERAVRYRDNYFPTGYIDDGIAHNPNLIHSKRIPDNLEGEKVYLNDIKILHFAHSRWNAQSSKLRYYSIVENINNTKPFYLRRFAYSCFYDETKNYPPEYIEVMPPEWVDDWDHKDINLRNLSDSEISWHDYEVLSFFKKYGPERFFTDDIWGFDWEKCRLMAKSAKKDAPDKVITGPNGFYKVLLNATDRLYLVYRKLSKF